MHGELPLIWTKAWTTAGSAALLRVASKGNQAPFRRLLEPMAALPAKVRQEMTAGDGAEKTATRTRYCRYWAGPRHGIELWAD
jgi:hypothetical protein